MDQNKVVKKRNRAIKACLTCRGRKQKCDLVKPQCHQCRIRNTECVYAAKESIKSQAAVVKTRISSISAGDLFEKDETILAGGTNPLKGVKFFFEKHGRWIACGATSMRTIFHLHSNAKFNHYFNKAWEKLKRERQLWKAKNNYSSAREWKLLEEQSVMSSGESIIDAVCRVLPSYEDIEVHLKGYFTGLMHRTFEIIDPEKVLADFRACFIKGPFIEKEEKHSIVTLIYNESHNLYCVGVIIEILRSTYYTTVPSEIEIFSAYLTSSASIKFLSIEKLQCVMLKACSLDFSALTGGDFSRAYMHIQMASSLAIDLGLNEGRRIPRTSNRDVYIDHLWRWVLYMDVQVSFNLGIPLQIREIDCYRLEPSSSDDKSVQFMKRAVLMLRKTMKLIYESRSAPDIEEHIQDLKDFIRTTYKPLRFYAAPENYKFEEGMEIHTLLFFLAVLCNLSDIQRYYYKVSNPETFNLTIQVSFTSLQICVAVMKSYYEMDKKDAGSKSRETVITRIPKHLQLAVWLTYHTLGRVIYEIYGLIFSSLQGRCLPCDWESRSRIEIFSTCSLDVSKDHFYSLKEMSNTLNSIFDILYSSDGESLVNIIKRSYCFLFVLSLERISRVILLKALETSEYINHPTEIGRTTDESDFSQVQTDHLSNTFWDRYDTTITDWIDNDLDLYFSQWFDLPPDNQESEILGSYPHFGPDEV